MGTRDIQYYNLCSNWMWVWSLGGGEIGVVFDLPGDCNKQSGEYCTNTGFWWYWIWTMPGYDYLVNYDLWNLDLDYCKTGGSQGSISGDDPVQGWNCYPGLGTVDADFAGITATRQQSTPGPVTDNNKRNLQAPDACPGYEIRPAHSFFFGNYETQYCPPAAIFQDSYGPVQLIMDASFSCEEPTSTEPASWGAVKSLFR